MPVYTYGSAEYGEAMTSPSLRICHDAGKEAGYDLGAILMGDGSHDAPVALLLELRPNDTLPRHRHDTYRVEVVVRGSMTLPDGRLATPGDVLVTPPGTSYGPHTAGPDGVLTVEIFASASGLLPNPDPDEADPQILEQFAHARSAMTAGLSTAGLL